MSRAPRIPRIQPCTVYIHIVLLYSTKYHSSAVYNSSKLMCALTSSTYFSQSSHVRSTRNTASVSAGGTGTPERTDGGTDRKDLITASSSVVGLL